MQTWACSRKWLKPPSSRPFPPRSISSLHTIGELQCSQPFDAQVSCNHFCTQTMLQCESNTCRNQTYSLWTLCRWLQSFMSCSALPPSPWGAHRSCECGNQAGLFAAHQTEAQPSRNKDNQLFLTNNVTALQWCWLWHDRPHTSKYRTGLC